ncbi:MAG TPA: hypothetical protein VK911_09325 [Vicinamibacterales bacterium]|nr:hypothetical protein [Vicinamibacterales bacterium]
MSFSVSDGRAGFEYGSRGLAGFFADRANLASAAHLRLLADIARDWRWGRGLAPGSQRRHDVP